jgi:LuxR family maltose regulon positive regulatory protein
MNASLLATKFHIPAPRLSQVARARLLEQLQCGLGENRKLTLISAPAGYGKTTLVVEWLNAIPHRPTPGGQADGVKVSWLSLDEADNDPMRFMRYFLAAFQRADKALDAQTQSLMESPSLPPLPSLLDELINELAAMNALLVIVLDDFHVIKNPDIHTALEYFLDHQPASTHLVLTTRADPLLPLARLRARRQMTEIRAHDLRFTAHEARTFFELANLSLAEHAVRALDERTEGWAAGLQLAALALQHHADPDTFIETFRGSHRYVLDYLAGEVIQQQDEETRAFLSQTSILDRFNAELCSALTGRVDSQDIINRLEQSNLFIIPLDDERCWFRYHHLFAEFLKSHLKRTQAGDLPSLHRRAAQWFQSNNYPEDALQHAFAIPDYAYVSRLVIDNWRLIYHKGRLSTAVHWLESLPGDLLRQSPPLGVAYCWTLFIRGEYERIGEYLDDISQAFDQMVATGKFPVEHPEYNIIAQQVILLRAVVMRHQGSVAAAIEDIEQLLPTIEELREKLGPLVVDMGYTACYSQLGYSYAAAGDFDQANEYLSRVSAHARACGNYFSLAHATMEWAKINLAQGQIEKAEQICRRELSLTEQLAYTDYPAFCLIQMALADVLCAKQSWDEAESLLSQGLKTARKSGHKYYLAQGCLVAARMHHAQGRPTQAQENIREAEQIAASIHNRFLEDVIAQTRAALENRPLPAQSLIEPLSEQEMRVLRLILAGKSNAEIAAQLVISVGTAKWHVHNILQKLGVGNRPQAIARARELGI